MPRAVLLALGLLATVELGLRAAPEGSLLGYGGGIAAYYEVLHTLQERGAADVAIVGSSRGREAIAVPELVDALRQGVGRELTVGNYSCPDAKPDANLLIVREMLASRSRPEILVYFLSPPLLRATGNDPSQVREIFGEFPDRYGNRSATWLAALTERPLWELRNWLWRNFATFRYRFRISNLASALLRGRTPLSAMQGTYTTWHVYTANRSLAESPPSPEQIRIYVEQMLDEGRYRVDDRYLNDLRDAVRLCREAGVRVMLVEEPLASALVAAYPPHVAATFRDRMAELEEETGLELVTLEELGLRLGPEDFREQSHVNLAGARKVTAALAELRLVPLLRAGDGGTAATR